MRTRVKAILLFVFVTVAGGCNILPVDGPRFHTIQKPTVDPGKAIIYVYRVGTGNEVKVGGVNISVDGKAIFSVKNTGFTWFYLSPGTHDFRAEWSFMEKPLFEGDNFDPKSLLLAVEAGNSYYINYRIERDNLPLTYAETNSLIGKAISKSHVISVKLVKEDETDGLQHLAWCSFQENEFK